MSENYRILLVDDEADIRKALRRTLHGFEITEAASPTEAVATLRSNHFDCVVSDYNMGDENGLDLLQRIRIFWPDTLRILLTGQTDVQLAIRALNEGSVNRFFLKPWDDQGLRTAIEIELHKRQRPVREARP